MCSAAAERRNYAVDEFDEFYDKLDGLYDKGDMDGAENFSNSGEGDPAVCCGSSTKLHLSS
jgi:hypothetical protein